MTSSMVENVARAMEPSAFATYDRGYSQANGHVVRAFLNSEKTVKAARRKARAAIEAMRDTTLIIRQDGDVVHELRGAPDDIWKDMLTGVLREEAGRG